MDTPPYAPPTGYRPAIGRESKGPLAQRTLCAQQDLALILEHLTTKPLETPLDPKSVEDSAHLIYADPETLSESERVRLWTLLDYFSNRMRPVTIEGLRLTDKFCRRKRFLQARGLGLVGIFVFTLLLQFYAMAGARTFAEVEQTAKEFFGVVDGVNLMQNARPELATETERARLFAISPDYVHLHDRYEALRTRQCYAYQGLYQWNAMWTSLAAWLRLQSPKAYWGTERPCSQDDADRPQIKYGTEIVARSLLDVLQTLVLPVRGQKPRALAMIGA